MAVEPPTPPPGGIALRIDTKTYEWLVLDVRDRAVLLEWLRTDIQAIVDAAIQAHVRALHS